MDNNPLSPDEESKVDYMTEGVSARVTPGAESFKAATAKTEFLGGADASKDKQQTNGGVKNNSGKGDGQSDERQLVSTRTALADLLGDPTYSISRAFDRAKGLTPYFRNDADNPISAPHTREPIVVSPEDETQQFSDLYTNFDEQFTQASSLLEDHPNESACLYLVHQEPDPRDSEATIDVVTFHQMQRGTDGTYTLRQIPAIHKLGVMGQDMSADRNERDFASILENGFTPHMNGNANVIIYREGERGFAWKKVAEGDEYFVELWSSYPYSSGSGELDQPHHAPELFVNTAQNNHTIYSQIGFTPPAEIRGVIMFPQRLTADQTQQRMKVYAEKYPGREFTFLQREGPSTVAIKSTAEQNQSVTEIT